MRLNAEKREELERTVPSAPSVRRELKQYLATTGMTIREFADAMGRSYNTIKYFLDDRYAECMGASDLMVRGRVADYIAQHPVTAQVEAGGRLYDTADQRILRACFTRALNRRRAYVVQADPGIGKTFGIAHLIAELNREEIGDGGGRRAYRVRASATMRPTQLLKEIAMACGVSPIGDARRVLRALRRRYAEHAVLIVIDEAQQLSIAALEAVRELLDEPPHCGLLITGSHELTRKFTVNAIELEQWNSRIDGFRTLNGLTEAEARLIVSEELPQMPEAGVKRLIKGATTPHLREKTTYISPRRLFGAIEELKTDRTESEVA